MENKVVINGIEYIRADLRKTAEKDGMQYCMVRTYSAGVFAGYVESREGKEVVLRDARRIWHWEGAATLSELATRGTSKPESCKFPCPVASVILTEVIEIIPITSLAQESIQGVPVWTE